MIKKRIMTALAGLIVALGLMVAVPAPASAASGYSCRYASGVTVCVGITWVKQDIVITSIGHETTVGCNKLENDGGGKYGYKAASTSNKSYYWPKQPCTAVHATYDACNNCTKRKVVVTMKRRINFNTDTATTFTFYLYNDGWYSVSSYNWS